MSTTRKPIRLETWIFAAVMVVLFALFAWRQFFGFNKNDEIFYISTVYRFFQGDAMLVDEWNNVQLFALLIYPFYSLIRLFHHSNTEMILIFRIGYLLGTWSSAAYCYIRLKRFGWVRILPALFYFMSTPYNINSLSYNTLAFGFVLLTLVTLASAEKWTIGNAFLCGLFTACASFGESLCSCSVFYLRIFWRSYVAAEAKAGRKPGEASNFRYSKLFLHGYRCLLHLCIVCNFCIFQSKFF